MAPHVLLMTRRDCHLCEEAAEVVARETEAAGAGWSAHDVDADPELRAEFGDRVPVVLVARSAPDEETAALPQLLERAVEIGYFRIAPDDLRRHLGVTGS